MRKMKKWNLNVMSAVIGITAMCMLGSCLSGGSNSSSGTTVGIVRMETKTFRNVLDIPDPSGIVSVYSPVFANMQEGACCWVEYTIDYNAPENDASIVMANGYYTVVITSKEEIDKYYMLSAMSDTATVMNQEVAIIDPNASGMAYLNGVMFLGHRLNKPQDQKEDWHLSYDPQNMTTNEYGKYIYNVYLRATIRTPDTKSPGDSYALCAYEARYFMEYAAQQAKAANSDRMYLRFNYVSEIKNGVPVWKQVQDLEIPVSYILPSQN